MAYNTLEEAQERIVELEEQVTTLTGERDTLYQNNTNLTEQVESLRTLNQKYFNKLIAQDDTENKKKDPEGETVPTCEEFATKLTI